MRKINLGLMVVMVLLLGLAIPASATGQRACTDFFFSVGHGGWRGHHPRWRHHSHRTRFHWGGVVALRPWCTYPYEYYPSPPVIIREETPLYVQPEEEEPYYWYYCPEAQGYYPYVRTCPGGWMKVVPDITPPGE